MYTTKTSHLKKECNHVASTLDPRYNPVITVGRWWPSLRDLDWSPHHRMSNTCLLLSDNYHALRSKELLEQRIICQNNLFCHILLKNWARAHKPRDVLTKNAVTQMQTPSRMCNVSYVIFVFLQNDTKVTYKKLLHVYYTWPAHLYCNCNKLWLYI